jgi:hypothetical protein
LKIWIKDLYIITILASVSIENWDETGQTRAKNLETVSRFHREIRRRHAAPNSKTVTLKNEKLME